MRASFAGPDRPAKEAVYPATFAVERHEGSSLWLVMIGPNQASRRIARFVDIEAVELWRKTHNAAIMCAREVGRSGL